jgi:hypothetical protein
MEDEKGVTIIKPSQLFEILKEKIKIFESLSKNFEPTHEQEKTSK